MKLAEMIKQRTQEVHDSMIEPEKQRQWDEVTFLISEAADLGQHSVTWIESIGYMADTFSYRWEAHQSVCKRLEDEGFHVFNERMANIGTQICW